MATVIMALAQRFDISCVGLWDADVLATKSASGMDASNNRDIVAAWMTLGLVPTPVTLDDSENLAALNTYHMFFMGTQFKDDFEGLFDKAFPGWKSQMEKEGYVGPIAYRRWAEQHPWSPCWTPCLDPLFQQIAEFVSESHPAWS